MGGQYNESSLIGTAVALPILSIVAVILRFHVRLRLRRTFIGVDDWLILGSVLLVCGHGVMQILSVVYGASGEDDIPEKTRAPARIAYTQKVRPEAYLCPRASKR